MWKAFSVAPGPWEMLYDLPTNRTFWKHSLIGGSSTVATKLYVAIEALKCGSETEFFTLINLSSRGHT